MHRTARALLFAGVAFVVCAPLSAAVYTVTLNNGTTFESRYQPRDASWDPQKVVFLDETGLVISMPKSEIALIESDVDQKGYGHMLDDTTMAFGWAPNDRGDRPTDEGYASSDVGGNETEEPVYNVNETPALPVFYGVSSSADQGPSAVPAPPPPVVTTTPPPAP